MTTKRSPSDFAVKMAGKVLPPYLNDSSTTGAIRPEIPLSTSWPRIIRVWRTCCIPPSRLSDDSESRRRRRDVQAAFRAFRKALGARTTGISSATKQ